MKTANSIFKIFLVALLLAVQVHFAYAQTAALLPVAPQQFFDKNGNPVTSGSVGYYIPGTTTLKQVWQDDSQSIPWTNPITLNAGGWPPNNKGIYGNGIYRQIVKDKFNNIISDQPTSATGSGGGSGTNVGDGNSVGTILAWSGMIAPNQYQFAYGQSLSRSTYPELLAAITQLSNVTCLGGNATLTGIADTSNIPVGAAVEGNCIVAGSTVVSKTINTITLSTPANISVTTTVRFFPFGNGNGSTTFNVPDLRGKVIPGRTNMGGITTSNLTNTYYGSDPDAIGANGGNQSFALALANLAQHNHSVFLNDPGHVHLERGATNPGGIFLSAAGSFTADGITNSNTTSSVTGITVRSASGGGGIANQTADTGSGTAFSLIQPSITLNYIIKVTPDISVSGLFGVASIGGMQGVITCGTGIVCVGNNISAITLPYVAQAANTVLANFTNSSATPIGNAVPSCSTAASALTYTTNVGFGCNTIAGSGTVNSGTINQLAFYAATGTAVSGNANVTVSSAALRLGVSGSAAGTLLLSGSTSGTVTLAAQATAGTPTITFGTSSGTPAVTASAPLAISATTGNISITGAAGQVLAGSTPAFTATPTLGVAGSTVGTLAFANATSGSITVSPPTGALGTVTNTLPAITATLTANIAAGTATLGTSAIPSATCATAVTVAATGTLTTDVVTASFNGDPTAVTGYVPLTSGMLTIIVYPTSGNVNFKVCNNTSSSITPGAITLNWKVVR